MLGIKFLIIIIIGCVVLTLGLIFLIKYLKNRKLDLEEIESLEEDLSEEEIKQDEKLSQTQVDLAKMLEQMQKDLDAEPVDIITTFEQDQEEKSIISYQELVKSLKDKKVQTIEETNNQEVKKVEIPVIDIENKKEENKKFHQTDVISPVYGKVKTKDEVLIDNQRKAQTKIEELLKSEDKDYKQVLEATLDLTPLKEEIKRNDEFLASLKEFRRNL